MLYHSTNPETQLFFDFLFYRSEWVLKWPGQSVLCVSTVFWTADVQSAIGEGPTQLAALLADNERELERLVELVRGKLKPQNRTTLGALVVIDVHARDVLTQLVKDGVQAENDFKWLCQLRYYWEVRTFSVCKNIQDSAE